MAEAGRRLKKLRQDREWSQDRLASLAGCSRTTICNTEGGLSWPSWGVLSKLGRALGVENLGRVLMEER